MAEEELEERLSIRVPKGFNSRLNEYIPLGIKSEVIRLILEGILAEFDERGKVVIGEILSSKYKIKVADGGEITIVER